MPTTSATMPTMKAALIVPAAGRGSRFGALVKKPFAELAGRAIFLRTLDRFVGLEPITYRIVAVSPDDLDFVRRTFGAELAKLKVDQIVAGGQERHDTVAAALAAVPAECELVAIHDGVRPLVPPQAVLEALRVAERLGAACVGMPVHDTVKRTGPGQIVEATVPRDGLWLAQTPQVFRTYLIRAAYARRGELAAAAGMALTDDCQLVEALGHPVAMVEGRRENLKITTAADLALAELLFKGGAASGVNS